MRPVYVPPVEEAWEKMARRLDERLPVVRRSGSSWVAFVVVVVGLVIQPVRITNRRVVRAQMPVARVLPQGHAPAGVAARAVDKSVAALLPARDLPGQAGVGPAPALAFSARAARLRTGVPLGAAAAHSAAWRTSLGVEWRQDGAALEIPGAFVRVRLDERMYVQAGVRIRAAQRTPRMQIDSTADSSKIRGWQQDIQGTGVALTKLYYLEVPVSVHYRATGGLWLGAGLQYGRLTGGQAWQNIVMYPTSGAGPNARPTAYSSGLISLRDNAHAYAKIRRTDWRALLDVSYTWKRFTLGVDYQQGLDTYVAGKRNASWGLHLGYAFIRCASSSRGSPGPQSPTGR